MTQSVHSSGNATMLLVRKFKEGQLKNARWSQRAFARKLGVSSGALSEILKGKRAISGPLKKKIANILQFSPLEQMEFFADDLPANIRPVRHEYFRLSVDQFHLISDWWHFAIINLLRTKGFRPEPKWLAERLGLPLKVASDAWDRLFRLGQLKRNNGKVGRAHPRLETTDDFFDLSVRRSHVEDTKLIEKSLMDGALESRDHTSVTFPMNRENIKKAKEMIRIFQDQFTEEIETPEKGEPGDEVYRLSISLFPLTITKEFL